MCTHIVHKGLDPEYMKNSKPIRKRQPGLLWRFFGVLFKDKRSERALYTHKITSPNDQ